MRISFEDLHYPTPGGDEIGVPDYIQDKADRDAARHAAEVAAWRAQADAESRMHPHMVPTIDRSGNPALTFYESMFFRGE